MKIWLPLCAALAITGSAYSIGHAQTGPGTEGSAHGGGHGALRAACQADLDKFCSDVATGGGRVMQCIRQHQDEVSDGCKTAIQSAHEHHWRHGVSPDAPASPTPGQPQG